MPRQATSWHARWLAGAWARDFLLYRPLYINITFLAWNHACHLNLATKFRVIAVWLVTKSWGIQLICVSTCFSCHLLSHRQMCRSSTGELIEVLEYLFYTSFHPDMPSLFNVAARKTSMEIWQVNMTHLRFCRYWGADGAMYNAVQISLNFARHKTC